MALFLSNDDVRRLLPMDECIAAMEGADALGHRLAGNHIAAGLDMLRAAHRKREDERLSA